MNKSLAILNGMLLSILVLSNGLMVEIFTNSPAVLANHVIGLTTIALLVFFTKEKWVSLKGIPLFFLLGGITGISNIYLINVSFLSLGATTTLMLSSIAQITASTTVDHFGLFGMKRYPFKPKKLIGLALMIIGLIFIVLF